MSKNKQRKIVLWYHNNKGDLMLDLEDKYKEDDYVCAAMLNGKKEPKVVYRYRFNYEEVNQEC